MNEDYQFTVQTVTFADGDTTPKSVTVTLLDDDVEETNEYADFQLSEVSGGATLGERSTSRLTVVDDDKGAGFIAGNELIVEYTWPAGQKDLDTGTSFLGQTVGFDWASSAPYMQWSGDDTSESGTEIVTVDLEQAAFDGVLPETFTIDAKAGWYIPAGGSGPATLNVYSRLKGNSGQGLFPTRRPISPGMQSGGAATSVGQAVFTYSEAAGVYFWSWN